MASNAVAGYRIGILTLDTAHPLEVGNVQHAESFAFPVTYAVVRNVSLLALMAGDPSAAGPILEGVAELNSRGVSIIVGACGSFANYQRLAADASRVPVFMSILLEVPFILRSLPLSAKLGIVFASTSSFTTRVQAECGIEDASRIIAIGADAIPAFGSILKQESSLDSPALERGTVELTQRTLREHPEIGAWLLQCSDLPPYAAAIQRATSLPVFDAGLLIDHLYRASRRAPFSSVPS
ncbi:MAG: aspartate/glutamate racemase family protein [Gammaproteobacteria bacterium]